MKALSIVLLMVFAFSSQVLAQSLNDLKQKYDTVSPLEAPSISTKQVVDAAASEMTPQEEQIVELRTKEEEDKKAEIEKVYLDTDYQFFQALAVPYVDDEMDKATKKDQVAVIIEKTAQDQKAVGGEIKTTTPAMLTAKQSAAVDLRRTLILKKIATNGQVVRACILQHKKPGEPFRGTAMTLAWEVDPTGKVENAQMKSTDVEVQEIKDCVVKALAEWNFSDIIKEKTKRSHIEYTYRFVNAESQAQN
jgi:hypothetical protein